MGTRSMIGFEHEDGRVEAVYCHWDGYLSGVGLQLVMFYDLVENVKALMKVGNMSSLGDKPEECKSYGDEPSRWYENRDAYLAAHQDSDIEYIYLGHYEDRGAYRPNVEWEVNKVWSGDKTFHRLPNPYNVLADMDEAMTIED